MTYTAYGLDMTSEAFGLGKKRRVVIARAAGPWQSTSAPCPAARREMTMDRYARARDDEFTTTSLVIPTAALLSLRAKRGSRSDRSAAILPVTEDRHCERRSRVAIHKCICSMERPLDWSSIRLLQRAVVRCKTFGVDFKNHAIHVFVPESASMGCQSSWQDL